MKRVNFVSLDFLTLQWFCNTLQTQHPQTQAAKELYDALEALYAGKSDSLMLELGVAIPEAASTSLVCGNLLIDSKSRRVIRDGAEIQLTPKEFDILYFLARNRGEVFTKEQIYQAVWAEEYYTADSNIMAFIRKLRKKIEPNPAPAFVWNEVTLYGYDPNRPQAGGAGTDRGGPGGLYSGTPRGGGAEPGAGAGGGQLSLFFSGELSGGLYLLCLPL